MVKLKIKIKIKSNKKIKKTNILPKKFFFEN